MIEEMKPTTAPTPNDMQNELKQCTVQTERKQMTRNTSMVAMVEFVFLSRKKDLMARAFVDEDGCDTAEDGDQSDHPPGEADHADVQSIAVPCAREDRADGSEGGGH